MSAGSTIHAAFQTYLETGDPDKGLFKLAMEYPHIHCWDSFDDRSWEACMATYFAMLEYARYDQWDIAQIRNHKGEVVPAIEVPFELVLENVTLPDGRGVSFIGYIDCIMRLIGTSDTFRTLDIKTHRDRAADRTANFVFDSQQIPYGLVLEHIQGKVVDSFEVEYLDVFLDLVEPRVTSYVYNKEHAIVNEWLFQLATQMKQLIRYMEYDLFPRAEHGCTAYFRPCKYLDMCGSRNKDAVQAMILLGQEPAEERAFDPWVRASITLPEEML